MYIYNIIYYHKYIILEQKRNNNVTKKLIKCHKCGQLIIINTMSHITIINIVFIGLKKNQESK